MNESHNLKLLALIIRNYHHNTLTLLYVYLNAFSLFWFSSVTLEKYKLLKTWGSSILMDMPKHIANKFMEPRLEPIFWIQVW